MMKSLLLLLLTTLSLAAAKPNILMLFADDMTWKSVAALSDEDIDTPNLDRLAARGTIFSKAYNPGGWNGAICIASRTMLMTGQQLWEAHDGEETLTADFVETKKMWPQILSASGYRTCFSGKWHIKADHTMAFDEVGHYRVSGMPKDRPNAYERPVEGKPDTWSPTDREEGGFWEGGKHWSEVVADDFETFLGEGDNEQPWFMYLSINAPHDPRQSPPEFLDRYPLSRMKVPVNYMPIYPHRDLMGAPQSLRDEKLAPTPRTEYAIKVHRREYYAIVTHLDAQIGRILDRLEKTLDAKNTYIVFTADHGLSCGEHGLVGKQNLYDASVRVPFFICGPGIPAGKTVDSPIYLQDIMPTTIKLAGAQVPAGVDFQDLRPHWEGTGTARPFIYGAYRHVQRMIEKDGQKLILYPEAKVARLFDLNTDPHEMNDLIGTPDGLARAKKLFRELVAEQKVMNDPLDLVSVYSSILR